MSKAETSKIEMSKTELGKTEVSKTEVSKTENKSRGILRRMEELHRLPLMILAWLFPLFLVKDMITGLLLGAGGVLVFLILEGSRCLFEKYLGSVLQMVSYLVMLVALSGIAGILLHLIRLEGADVPFYCFVLEQMASVYLMKMLVNGAGEEKTKKEAEELETGEKTEEKKVWKELLSSFEIAAEYAIFLGIFGLLREYAGKWIVSAGLFSGGYLITSGFLFLWKLTKTMPERFEKLPGMMLSTGLIVLVLAGFAGLL